MIRQYITTLKDGNTYQAIEVFSHDAEEKAFFIRLRRRKNELELMEQPVTTNLETISKKIKKIHPIFVVINSPQVLSKIIPATKGDDLSVVNKAFPNISVEDFYYECVSCGRNALVTVCRKTQVDTLLKKIKTHRIPIAGWTLGISQIMTVLPYVSSDVIMLSHMKIRLSDQQIEALDREGLMHPESYTVNGMKLNSHSLLGFSAILSSLLKQPLNRSNFGAMNIASHRDFYHQRFFRLFLRLSLAMVVGLLVFNFINFIYYYKKVADLEEIAEVQRHDQSQLSAQQQQLKLKKERVDAIWASSSSKSAFYIDRLTAIIPMSVVLDVMSYQPLQKKIQENMEIDVQHNAIVIRGISKDHKAFSDWITKIERQLWVHRAIIQEYYAEQASEISFTLQITLKNEQ